MHGGHDQDACSHNYVPYTTYSTGDVLCRVERENEDNGTEQNGIENMEWNGVVWN